MRRAEQLAPAQSTRADAERVLIGAVRAGSTSAFEQVYRSYREALTRVAARFAPSAAVADEVVQDVFLRIWRTRSTWDPGDNLTAHLFAVTRNAAMNAGRRGALEARYTAADVRLDNIADRMAGPDADADAHERNRALAAAILALPARAREAFLLRWRDGLSYADTARVMGTSVKTVEKQLASALKAIRRALGPEVSHEL
jgi:RNA polymerase sigma-70 factor (family 1)